MNKQHKAQQKSKRATIGFASAGGVLAIAFGILLWLEPMADANATEITVYKSPTCGCCRDWVDHLQDEGFKVIVHDRNNMDAIKSTYGVKRNLQSCHTAAVEGYVIEGHVPASDIKRLLKEKPKFVGLTAPGMPQKSPGMQPADKKPEGYDVLSFTKQGETKVYTRY